MQEELKKYLFAKGILVGEETPAADAFHTVFALARLFGIRVTEGAALAAPGLIRFAAAELGENVPAPFYRGFPQSVRELSPEALLFDQLLSYAVTYGLGDFSTARHSVFEEPFERIAFRENTAVQPFRILTEAAAYDVLRAEAAALLAGTRPLGQWQFGMLTRLIAAGEYEVTACACKVTAADLLLATDDLRYARFLKLADVFYLTERLHSERYGMRDVRALNLKNRDRRLIAAVIDLCFTRGEPDVRPCFEKRAFWCGLLHHLHYRPVNAAAAEFVRQIREKEGVSAYSEFEALLAAGDVCGAARSLAENKGTGAVLRRLDHLLSRCSTPEETDGVLALLDTNNPVLLLQLLRHYTIRRPMEGRTFRFVRFNLTMVHTETVKERLRRRSAIPDETAAALARYLRAALDRRYGGLLPTVYADPAMKKTALPLREGAAQGGYGTLPCGSRLPIGEGEKLRGFVYWEKTDDIDLSVLGLDTRGNQIEFSWRTMAGAQSRAITYSGDQTSGYDGGSEFFDVDLPLLRSAYPFLRYLVFCCNEYGGDPFKNCVCRAGYMLRAREDSGEVFEPKTVRSAFTVNCDSSFAYLFGVDLETREFVWLNESRSDRTRVAGTQRAAFLLEDFISAQVYSVYDLAAAQARTLTDRPEEADVVFSDAELALRPGAVQIRSCDFAQLLALMNGDPAPVLAGTEPAP